MPQAIGAMRRVVELKPDDYEARLGLGTWLAEAGQHGEASMHLERAAMLRMDSRDAWHRLAQSYEADGRPRDALGAYRRVLTLLGKEDPALLLAILRVAMRDRDGAAAVDAARRLQAFTPGHRGFLVVGRALLVQGDNAAALQELEKAVALEPSSIPARLSLSEAYARLGQAESAADQVLRAIRLEPKNPELYRILSERYEEAGRLDLAIVAMRDGVDAAGAAPRAIQAEMSARLVLLYELAGMTREAARERKRAESL
jgi:predicted Zn-dependent protease